MPDTLYPFDARTPAPGVKVMPVPVGPKPIGLTLAQSRFTRETGLKPFGFRDRMHGHKWRASRPRKLGTRAGSLRGHAGLQIPIHGVNMDQVQAELERRYLIASHAPFTKTVLAAMKVALANENTEALWNAIRYAQETGGMDQVIKTAHLMLGQIYQARRDRMGL